MLACKGVYGDRTDVFWIFQKKIPLGPLGNISANFSKVNHEIFKVLHVKVSQKNVHLFTCVTHGPVHKLKSILM